MDAAGYVYPKTVKYDEYVISIDLHKDNLYTLDIFVIFLHPLANSVKQCTCILSSAALPQKDVIFVGNGYLCTKAQPINQLAPCCLLALFLI